MKAKLISESLGDVLKPKTIEEIEDILSKFGEFFTVKDLKKWLESVPDYLPVGTNNHFGEFEKMDEYDFTISTTRITPDIILPFLQITTPDIGEEPN